MSTIVTISIDSKRFEVSVNSSALQYAQSVFANGYIHKEEKGSQVVTTLYPPSRISLVQFTQEK